MLLVVLLVVALVIALVVEKGMVVGPIASLIAIRKTAATALQAILLWGVLALQQQRGATLWKAARIP
jgi:hypothetical protein